MCYFLSLFFCVNRDICFFYIDYIVKYMDIVKYLSVIHTVIPLIIVIVVIIIVICICNDLDYFNCRMLKLNRVF